MKIPGIAWILLIGAIAMPSVNIASGGGGMSGSSMPQSQPQKTPQQKALESYNRGIKARDKAHKLEDQLASATSEKAVGKLQRKIAKQYKKAIKQYRSSIKNEPRLYQAHGALGYALKQSGDLPNAMIAYNECLKLKPEYTPAIEYRAEAYLGIGRFDEVITAHEDLGTRDKGHQRELELAITAWLDKTDRDDTNELFYDWATTIAVSGG